MKGIVAQIEGKYAVVLTQDGSFRKVRAKPFMETGIEIDMDQPAGKVRNTRYIMKAASIAAAALLALGTAYGAYSYAMPYSYVHLDINPSIELTANVYDRIIKVKALNEDGQKLLEGRNLNHSRLEIGVSDLLDLAVDKGYLADGDLQAGGTVPVGMDSSGAAAEGTAGTGTEGQEEIDNAVLLTISSDSSKKSGELKKELRDIAARELVTDKIDSEVLVGEASLEQRNEAMELGVTPGKLALIENAIEAEPELQLEELKKDSVKELLKKIRENEKKKLEKSNSGAKSGVNGQNAQKPASGKNQDNSVQTENTAVGKNPGKVNNPGNGKPDKDKLKPGNNTKSQMEGQTVQGSEVAADGTGLAALDEVNGIPAQIRGLIKNRGQNKTDKNDSQYKSQSENTYKGLDESTGSNPKGKNRNGAVNKGKQAKSGIGKGSSGKIDEADRKTAGKGANELKLQREKLRNDLLDQMEKQLNERKNKSNGKNTIEGNKDSGKTNVNNNGKKR